MSRVNGPASWPLLPPSVALALPTAVICPEITQSALNPLALQPLDSHSVLYLGSPAYQSRPVQRLPSRPLPQSASKTAVPQGPSTAFFPLCPSSSPFPRQRYSVRPGVLPGTQHLPLSIHQTHIFQPKSAPPTHLPCFPGLRVSVPEVTPTKKGSEMWGKQRGNKQGEEARKK